MRLKLAAGLIALAGFGGFTALSANYWLAPKRTVDSLIQAAPTFWDVDEVWRQRAAEMLPIGLPDREVERRLAKAGFEVGTASNGAQLSQPVGSCWVGLTASWRLDDERRLIALTSNARAACI